VAATQHLGALIEALGGRLAHLLLDVVKQRPPAVVFALEQRERRVEPAAVEVRVEVAEARRQAAAHLPVGRGIVAAPERATAVAQPEERVELPDQLDRRRPSPHRPDVYRPPGRGLGRHVEHRIRDVEACPHVYVAVRALELDVPRRAARLDQAVLEHERAELGVGRAVVDDLRPSRPAGRAAEV